MSQFFTSGSESVEVSASASVLPMNIQDWSPLGWAGWISLQSEGLSRVFSHTAVQKHQFFGAQPSLWSSSHIHTWPQEKPWLWLDGPLVVMSCLCFLMLSRWVIAFLPRSKCLLISWLQSPSAVILEPKKIKSVTASIVSPSICHEVMGLDANTLVFWILSFKLIILVLNKHWSTFCLHSYACSGQFYKRNHILCGVSCIAHFIQHNVFMVYPCCSTNPYFILFCGQVIFHCINISHFAYSLTDWCLLGYFYHFTIVNNAATNICIQVVIWTYVFISLR